MNDLQKKEYEILVHFDEYCKENNLKYSLYAGTLLGAVRHNGFIPWDDDIDVSMTREVFNIFEDKYINYSKENPGFRYQSRKIHRFQAYDFSKIRSNSLNIRERLPKTQVENFGPWIDIFPLDNIPDDETLRINQFNKVEKYNNIIKKLLLVQVEPNDQGLRKVIKATVQFLNEKLHKINPILPIIFKLREKEIQKYNDIETSHVADLTFMYHRNYDRYKNTQVLRSNVEDLVEMKFEDALFSVPREFDRILSDYYGDYMILPPEEDRKVHKLEFDYID